MAPGARGSFEGTIRILRKKSNDVIYGTQAMTETVSSRRRARERTQIRARILDAARELFAAEGYDAVTMRRVAERIEYTPPVIYQHFADKATLIREICIEDFRALAHAFQAVAKIEDPVDRLQALAECYVDFALEHPNQYRLMFMSPRPSDVDLGRTMHELHSHGNPELDGYAFLRKVVDDIFAAGRFHSVVRDPEMTAQALWAVVHGVVALHIARADEAGIEWRDPRATARLACGALLVGLLKSE